MAPQTRQPTLAAMLYSTPNRAIMNACKVSEDTAARWRNGQTLPYPRYVKVLAKLLKVPETDVSAAILDAKARRGLAGHHAPGARKTAHAKRKQSQR